VSSIKVNVRRARLLQSDRNAVTACRVWAAGNHPWSGGPPGALLPENLKNSNVWPRAGGAGATPRTAPARRPGSAARLAHRLIFMAARRSAFTAPVSEAV